MMRSNKFRTDLLSQTAIDAMLLVGSKRAGISHERWRRSMIVMDTTLSDASWENMWLSPRWSGWAGVARSLITCAVYWRLNFVRQGLISQMLNTNYQTSTRGLKTICVRDDWDSSYVVCIVFWVCFPENLGNECRCWWGLSWRQVAHGNWTGQH